MGYKDRKSDINNIIKAGDKMDNKKAIKIIENIKKVIIGKDSLPHLSHYLQIPQDKITKETINLVKEIVKDKKTGLEKALALEEYLRNNYSYNLEVEEVPKNQEFIHHFLFESKEGYCTYFATALAIMLRIEGIPTRYIEPIGWMTLDATPAYAPIVRADNAPSTEEEEVERLPEDLDVRDSSLWLDFQTPQDDMEGYLENDEGEDIAYQDSWTEYIKNLQAIIIFPFIFILIFF